MPKSEMVAEEGRGPLAALRGEAWQAPPVYRSVGGVAVFGSLAVARILLHRHGRERAVHQHSEVIAIVMMPASLPGAAPSLLYTWGPPCLSACLRPAVSIDHQSASADGPAACGQTGRVTMAILNQRCPKASLSKWDRAARWRTARPDSVASPAAAIPFATRPHPTIGPICSRPSARPRRA